MVTENHTFCEQPIHVEPAPEPSNIIWENRHITSKVQFRNKIFVGIGVFCLLALAFALFTFCKIAVVNTQKKYPPTFDCSDIDAMFGTDLDAYKTYAEIDKEYTIET